MVLFVLPIMFPPMYQKHAVTAATAQRPDKRNFQILNRDIGLTNIDIGLLFCLRTVGFDPSCALSQNI